MRSELVNRARAGDREAFDVVMLDSIDRLYSIARLVAQDSTVAEDAVQETLVRCWRDLPALRDVDRFEAWLRKLLLNAIAEEYRKRRRFEATVRILRAEPSIGDASAGLADRDEMERAFRVLSVEHRAVLILHHYLGLSEAETAASLGVPRGTAKSRLHYALAALKASLESDARSGSRGEATA